MKIERKQYKPIKVTKDENGQYKAYEKYPYCWHEVDKSALQEIMPSNDRLDELLLKMAKEGTPRKYGGCWWKVEL